MVAWGCLVVAVGTAQQERPSHVPGRGGGKVCVFQASQAGGYRQSGYCIKTVFLSLAGLCDAVVYLHAPLAASHWMIQ